MPGPSPAFVVANFNLHAGIDGWGRPFDVVEHCRAIDADVLVLEECWTPAERPETGQASVVAAALGYTVVARTLATGRRAGPHPRADERWMRPLDWRGSAHAIYLDGDRPLARSAATSERFRSAEPGGWGIALLSRLPVAAHHVIELGRLPWDRARRAALVARLEVGSARVTVVGTHMSHLSYGSPIHFRRLAAVLDADPEAARGPAVLVGDMNLWGPPLLGLLSARRAAGRPPWRRAVKGRTWPAWRPHSQVDHILVRGPLAAERAEVLPMAGSDHRPVRARLVLESPENLQ
ncbi:MAG: endonuclease/exonuclease/phosphatase family protein [Actinomycetota bacterium]|nr:endonuclease/exonuclease/phosphatase family protein [Actinomycetota bacterium]